MLHIVVHGSSMLEFFWKGFALGFAIAVPVGPVGILCIRRTLQFGKISGIASGFGAATADALFGLLAALGITFLSSQLLAWSYWFKLVGGIFLLFLSYRSFISRPKETQEGLHKMSLVKDFVSTFFLTLTNPLTFLCYIAIFAAMGFTAVIENAISTTSIVVGVFVGAFGWWFLLSEGVSHFRHKLTQQTMIWINRISGTIMGLFGAWSLTSLFFT